MNDYGIKVGDKVQCGVHVLGEWKPSSIGIVVSQTGDGSVSGVDVMSLHGGAPWVRQEATSHLRRVPAAADLALDGMMARDQWPAFMTPNVTKQKERAMTKIVEVVITEPTGRNLNCKVGDRFFGTLSNVPDWQLGCHYVTLSDQDAARVGEATLCLGYTCELVTPN